MKVSFIIVSWNVEELLKECIQSILRRSYFFPIEVIVIDNASRDGSVTMVSQNFPSVKLICNDKNKGFGAACNQGIAAAMGEYIFLLNPDSTLEDSALETLVSYMDTHPDVGMSAPQIRNGDGSIQQSIRGFPSSFSQLLILLKLRRWAPSLKALRRYFALDFDYTKNEQEVDQPMGAAMIIRSSVLKKIGVFDEQFFLWFEEVDLCKRMRDAGYAIRYISSAHVVHYTGKSFSQQSILERQKNFFRSCGRYVRKHCGFGGIFFGTCMAAFAWCVESVELGVTIFRTIIPRIEKPHELAEQASTHPLIDKNIVLITLGILLGIEILSFVGYLYAPITAVAFGTVVAGVFLLGVWKLEYAVAALFAELIIGSKGYLLSITVDHATISLRMALFAVMLAAWIITEIRMYSRQDKGQKTFLALYRESHLLKWYSLIVGIAAIGVVNGVMQGNITALIFADSNAWLFFIVAPCVYRAFVDRGCFGGFLSVMTAAITAQIVKVLLVFYVMGHKGFGQEWLTIFYRWIRSTGVGEITQLPHLYRVFFQSQVYIVILVCVLAVILAYRIREECLFSSRISLGSLFRQRLFVPLLMLSGAWASLILSFSRSFWLGTATIGLIMLIIIIWKWRGNSRSLTVWMGGNLCAIAVSFLLLFTISLIPIPSSDGSFTIDSLSDRVKNVQDEAAAASRWNLLPVLAAEIVRKPLIGYGFGKTVTYVSHDPRVVLANPSGEYTTYAFEWGYLDMLVKLGLLGLFAYLLMLRELFFLGMRAINTRVRRLRGDMPAIISGLIFGVSALLVVHVFTPYLNHPLGIGFIILSGLVFERFSVTEDDTHSPS